MRKLMLSTVKPPVLDPEAGVEGSLREQPAPMARLGIAVREAERNARETVGGFWLRAQGRRRWNERRRFRRWGGGGGCSLPVRCQSAASPAPSPGRRGAWLQKRWPVLQHDRGRINWNEPFWKTAWQDLGQLAVCTSPTRCVPGRNGDTRPPGSTDAQSQPALCKDLKQETTQMSVKGRVTRKTCYGFFVD